jgi:hypothetical protein
MLCRKLGGCLATACNAGRLRIVGDRAGNLLLPAGLSHGPFPAQPPVLRFGCPTQGDRRQYRRLVFSGACGAYFRAVQGQEFASGTRFAPFPLTLASSVYAVIPVGAPSSASPWWALPVLALLRSRSLGYPPLHSTMVAKRGCVPVVGLFFIFVG